MSTLAWVRTCQTISHEMRNCNSVLGLQLGYTRLPVWTLIVAKAYAYILLPDAFPVTNSLFIRFVECMEVHGESTSPTSLGPDITGTILCLKKLQACSIIWQKQVNILMK